jgi:hypothetical protein
MKELFRVSSAGHGLSCFVCRHDTFDRRSMTLLTSGIANSGFNKRGQIAICATCGYVHTFMGGTRLVWQPIEDEA